MRDNKKYKILGLGLLLIIMSISIPSSVISLVNNSDNSYKDLIYSTGVIKYIPLEGGFFGIISDDGNHYDPINLPPDFENDGLTVIFIGEILNLVSAHMWGRIIRIFSIQIYISFYSL